MGAHACGMHGVYILCKMNEVQWSVWVHEGYAHGVVQVGGNYHHERKALNARRADVLSKMAPSAAGSDESHSTDTPATSRGSSAALPTARGARHDDTEVCGHLIDSTTQMNASSDPANPFVFLSFHTRKFYT